MRLVSFAAAEEAGSDQRYISALMKGDMTQHLLIRLLIIVVKFDLFLNDSKSHDQQQVVC